MWEEARKSLKRAYDGEYTSDDIEPLQKYFFWQLSRVGIKGVNYGQKYDDFLGAVFADLFPRLKEQKIDDDQLWEKFDDFTYRWVREFGLRPQGEIGTYDFAEPLDEEILCDQADQPYDALRQKELVEQSQSEALAELCAEPLEVQDGFTIVTVRQDGMGHGHCEDRIMC